MKQDGLSVAGNLKNISVYCVVMHTIVGKSSRLWGGVVQITQESG